MASGQWLPCLWAQRLRSPWTCFLCVWNHLWGRGGGGGIRRTRDATVSDSCKFFIKPQPERWHSNMEGSGSPEGELLRGQLVMDIGDLSVHSDAHCVDRCSHWSVCSGRSHTVVSPADWSKTVLLLKRLISQGRVRIWVCDFRVQTLKSCVNGVHKSFLSEQMILKAFRNTLQWASGTIFACLSKIKVYLTFWMRV